MIKRLTITYTRNKILKASVIYGWILSINNHFVEAGEEHQLPLFDL